MLLLTEFCQVSLELLVMMHGPSTATSSFQDSQAGVLIMWASKGALLTASNPLHASQAGRKISAHVTSAQTRLYLERDC